MLRTIEFAVLAAAALLIVAPVVVTGFGLFILGMTMYALLPYVVLVWCSRRIDRLWMTIGASGAALAAEIGVRAAVFVYPAGSTSALALLFSPLWIGFLIIPAGGAAGWLIDRLYARAGWIGGVPATIVFAVSLGLGGWWIARPDQFPTMVAARNTALVALGEPRVITGGDRFTRTSIHTRTAWHVSGDLDQAAGEEVAIVGHDGAEILDPATLKTLTSVTFGGRKGDLWSWYSRLLRVGDQLMVAQTGGGYSETELRTLANEVSWRFHPDARTMPSAMLPCDLDGDGEIEFYASASAAIARVDVKGQTVWTRDSPLSNIMFALPPRGDTPAWVVASRYGAGIDVWSSNGDRLASLPWRGEIRGIADWPAQRHLLFGDRSVKGVTVDGTKAFDIPFDQHLQFYQGLSWTYDANQPPVLVVMTGDWDIKRWRLRLIAQPATATPIVVYDEVFDHAIRPFVVAGSTGERLFIAGDGLNVISPSQAATPFTSGRCPDGDASLHR